MSPLDRAIERWVQHYTYPASVIGLCICAAVWVGMLERMP